MKPNKVKIIVLAGIAAFIGTIAIQLYWLRQAFDAEETKLSQNIQVSLLEVANEINHYYGYTTAHANPVEKISKDYYIVNMRNDFDAKVLELLLVNKFKTKGINTDFEYGIYDCETDDILYGSYVNLDKKTATAANTYFPKVQNLVYYFAVRFPAKNSFIYSTLKGWIILCIVMIVTLAIYLYAIYIILQQQKYANLQRDFINNMTHEFKTPLASILIASNFLSKHETIKEDDKLEQYSRIIIDQGKKLDGHLEKILNIARHEKNPMLLNKEATDIIEMVNKTVDIIKLKYPAATISINNQLKHTSIQADAFHFANIIYNFLDNAVKYCNREPEIKIDLKEDDKAITMSFKDNGIGISSKSLKHIFEKFYRAPESKQLAVNGFGLGLYYVKKICELHGWKIKADSVPGEGTIITLSLNKAFNNLV